MCDADHSDEGTLTPDIAHLYTAAAARELDARLIAREASSEGAFAVMERAAAAMFRHLQRRWPTANHLRIFCGPGNNGGDGYVIAGLASTLGWAAHVVQVGDTARATAETRRALAFAQEAGATVQPFAEYLRQKTDAAPDVIVDALLGTGFRGTAEGDFASAIEHINGCGAPVLAADVPSGLSADTGSRSGPAVRAQLTVTVVACKQGLFTGQAADHVGAVAYEPLVEPDGWVQAGCHQVPVTARLVSADLLSLWMPRRQRTSHKGHFGQVLVVGGDLGMGGAPLMAAQAAARAGAGKVVLMSRSAHVAAMLARQPEVMTQAVDDVVAAAEIISAQVSSASVVVLGPGLGQSAWSRALFAQVLRAVSKSPAALVVDADGLNLLAENLSTTLASFDARRRAQWILTPHPGEAARLLGCSTGEVEADRFAAVRRLRDMTGAQCLLKGAGSLMAFSASGQPASGSLDVGKNAETSNTTSVVEICADGNPGMASGGMGDVLAGLAGGLLAQRFTAVEALRIAVCVHARAGDMAVSKTGEQGLLASDLYPELMTLWAGLATAGSVTEDLG